MQYESDLFHPHMNPLSSSRHGVTKSIQKVCPMEMPLENALTKIPSRSLATFFYRLGKTSFTRQGFLIQNERTITVKIVLFDFPEITVDTLDGSEIRLTS